MDDLKLTLYYVTLNSGKEVIFCGYQEGSFESNTMFVGLLQSLFFRYEKGVDGWNKKEGSIKYNTAYVESVAEVSFEEYKKCTGENAEDDLAKFGEKVLERLKKIISSVQGAA